MERLQREGRGLTEPVLCCWHTSVAGHCCQMGSCSQSSLWAMLSHLATVQMGDFTGQEKKPPKSLQTEQIRVGAGGGGGGGGSESESHLSHATSSAQRLLRWLLSPLQHSMG